MINKILPFLNRLLPTKLAYDALQKANPKLKKFATGAIAAGYTIDQTMDFLRDKFTPEQTEDFGGRPDEKAAARQVENSKQLPKALMKGASLAGGALGGLAAIGMDGNEDQDQAIRPDEIQQMPQQQQQRQLPYNQQRLQIGETPMNPIPQQGEVITPPISPQQQQQAKKQTALNKFQGHKQNQQIRQMQQNQPNQQERIIQAQQQYAQKEAQKKSKITDEAIIAALEKLLQM